jgi:hypothetical protein
MLAITLAIMLVIPLAIMLAITLVIPLAIWPVRLSGARLRVATQVVR